MGTSFIKNYLPSSLAHSMILNQIYFYPSSPPDPILTKKIGDITFTSPIGAAAGLSKSGEKLDALSKLGFGFIEIGSVTPTPEYAAPKAVEILDDSCVHKGTQESHGIMWVKRKLLSYNSGVIGVNVHPNQETILSIPYKCDDTYLYGLVELYPFINFFVLNISSNPVVKLAQYEDSERLRTLCQKIVNTRDTQIALYFASALGQIYEEYRKPRSIVPLLFVKIGTNWPNPEELVDICIQEGIDGIIVSGTNAKGEAGQSIKNESISLLEKVAARSNGKLIIISAGGIQSGQDVYERLKAGASLVQIYSLMFTEDPSCVSRLNSELTRYFS